MRDKSSILIVDDDRDLADLVERILTEGGYQVTKAYDGNSALVFLEDHEPDLVILDIILPDLDGFELLKRIRGLYDIPVIMFTIRTDISSLRKAIEGGADDYIKKPFRRSELLTLVKAKLARSEQ